jgi:hypothetical protein
MEKGALIGRGRTAEVFAWGEGRALKLYYEGWPAAAAEAEYRKAEAVHRAGAAAPSVDGVVQVDGRHGVIYGGWILSLLLHHRAALGHYPVSQSNGRIACPDARLSSVPPARPT